MEGVIVLLRSGSGQVRLGARHLVVVCARWWSSGASCVAALRVAWRVTTARRSQTRGSPRQCYGCAAETADVAAADIAVVGSSLGRGPSGVMVELGRHAAGAVDSIGE